MSEIESSSLAMDVPDKLPLLKAKAAHSDAERTLHKLYMDGLDESDPRVIGANATLALALFEVEKLEHASLGHVGDRWVIGQWSGIPGKDHFSLSSFGDPDDARFGILAGRLGVYAPSSVLRSNMSDNLLVLASREEAQALITPGQDIAFRAPLLLDGLTFRAGSFSYYDYSYVETYAGPCPEQAVLHFRAAAYFKLKKVLYADAWLACDDVPRPSEVPND